VIVLLSVQPLDLTKSENKETKDAGAPGSEAKPIAEAKKEPQSKSKTAKP
jgi:hypothetical protein